MVKPEVTSMGHLNGLTPPTLEDSPKKQDGGSIQEPSEEEEQTVLTSPLSLSSLSPDNPVYLQLSQEDDSDDHSIPTMDHTGSSSTTDDARARNTNLLTPTASGFLLRTTSSLSRDDEQEEKKPMAAALHNRKPSTISDLPPPGFFQSNSNRSSSMAASSSTSSLNSLARQELQLEQQSFVVTKFLKQLTRLFLRYGKNNNQENENNNNNWGAAWIGFWALGMVTCANYMLSPMRDAIALQVGVQHMPALTLASTGLAIVSSVPIGWLFEAPDPKRRKLWKQMGLTRGETQGTSLALFYRFFAVSLLCYAVGFELNSRNNNNNNSTQYDGGGEVSWISLILAKIPLGKFMYVAFFLVVHLMKLHSLSLVWGVTTEAMEYEELAKTRRGIKTKGSSKTRLQILGLVGFGGTMGGILGSIIASTTAHLLNMSGLLVVSCVLLEWSAQLSIELGRIMQIHWEEERRHPSTTDLGSLLDTSMKRSQSMESMKRVASGNSLNMVRSKSMQFSSNSNNNNNSSNAGPSIEEQMNDNSFTQRLLRGITTILRSRLLMAIFTYNALFASTSVLLSFQRAELVVNRSNHTGSATDDTAFLARINICSSVAVFLLQASGMGPYIAHACGQRGTLALIPILRLVGVASLAWWHLFSKGQPPNLLLFLLLDECTKVINFAVAKPVRESLWRGLSNEARYEAKPIVDTLANRWGGGSAAFLVSLMDKAVMKISKHGTLFGISPNMVLCLVVAVWWAAVSADLGHVRRRIDLELSKKNQ